MTEAKIKFAAGILKRLGEELNPTPDQGILELVKNSYDADATKCEIRLLNVDKSGGSIFISDNGTGMTQDEIINGWLVLGHSTKTTAKTTKLGRIPAGNKGLGRLAALRMGTGTGLSTRPSGGNEQFDLHIDWSEFERVELVENVNLTIEASSIAPSVQPGTDILIEGLHRPIPRMAVKRLARALILLADPFSDNPSGFRPTLVSPEYEDLALLVKRRYFDSAEYVLTASLDDKGNATASVLDWKGEVLFQAGHIELASRREHKPYNCPPAQFDLWVFILSQEVFLTRHTTIGEVREWLAEFGGVHLYENGLRVMPYGNPGNDWLDINLRRAQSPEERPSTNTVIGRVSVTDTSDSLIQKTDRSGFIETTAFGELRSFAQDVLEWMGRRRLDAALARRSQERQQAPKQTQMSFKEMSDAINSVPLEARESLRRTFSQYQRSRDNEVENLKQEIQLYRTLSTAGITASVFAHESSGNPMKVITMCLNSIERRGAELLGDQYSAKLQEPVTAIRNEISRLTVLSSATLGLLQHEKRRIGHVDVHRVVSQVTSTLKPFIDGREVDLDFALADSHPFLRGSEAALESIVTNLINNSLVAFEEARVERRRILIETSVQDLSMRIRVMDNGPGINGINVKDVWLPGQTTRKNGTGLGLTIVRDTVIDLGGRVYAIAHGSLSGAEIVIELPILGK